MSSECHYAFSRLPTASGKVRDGHWRRYFVVFSSDSYRDRTELSQSSKALVDHPLPITLSNVQLYLIPRQYLAEDYTVVPQTITEQVHLRSI